MRSRAQLRDGCYSIDTMDPGPNEPTTGDVLASRYRLERRLGEGGMGVVWEARQLATDKVVAVKVLKAQDSVHATRFAREAKLTASLSHRNIVQVFDYWEADGAMSFLVMEYLEGRSLAQELAIREAFSLHDGLEVLRSVVEALTYAHDHGIIHRDLKPENVFIAATDIKLLDFGLAKRHVVESDATIMTQSGAVMGTPHYMAPEQIFGASDVDSRADVWALGVLTYEVLSGQKPFVGDNFGQIFHAIAQGTPRPLKEAAKQPIPQELNELVKQMLEKDRCNRPTISVVASKLAAVSAPSKDGGSTDNTTVIMARTAPFLSVLPPSFEPRPALSTAGVSLERTPPVGATPAPLARKASSGGGRGFVAAAVGLGALGLAAAAGTYLRHTPAPIEATRESPTVVSVPASASGVELGDGGLGSGPATTDAAGLASAASVERPATRPPESPMDPPTVRKPTPASASSGKSAVKVDPLAGGRF